MSDEESDQLDRVEEVSTEGEETAGMASAEVSSDGNSSAAEAGDIAAELREQVSELQDKLARSWADLENYRRRVQKDQDEARRYESLRLIHDLLPGLDSLGRAIATAEQTGDQAALLEGIRMVLQQFRDILRGHSAEPIEPKGQPFDPNLHEALTQVPSADHEPMTVLEVVEVGYRMHDRVVRPARVIVTCAPPEE